MGLSAQARFGAFCQSLTKKAPRNVSPSAVSPSAVSTVSRQYRQFRQSVSLQLDSLGSGKQGD